MSFEKRKWSSQVPLIIGYVSLTTLVAVLGVWGVYARIAGAVIASGMIQVESNRQVVQHPDGGVVGEILAKNGDIVSAGDVVLRLEDTLLRSELAIIEGQLFELWARKARLEAERDERSELVPSKELAELAQSDESVAELLEGQERLFLARSISLNQEVDQLTEQIIQTENQVKGSLAQLEGSKLQEELIAKELEDAQSLLEKGLMQATRVSGLQREHASMVGEIGSLEANVAQLRGQIAALEIQKLRLKTQRREDSITTLRDLQHTEIELIERRLTTKETISRQEIRSPVSGVIHDSKVFAIKAVVTPAEPIMFVIPKDQPLVVSAQVESIHIDQVHVGQEAALRFAALDQRTTPEIIGRVTRLSADVFVDELTGASYYQAELMPNDGELTKLGKQELLPGMPVDAFIRTSERSPINYLAKPMIDYFARAWRED